MLLCRRQATAILGSSCIFNAIWRHNWKSMPCMLSADRLDDPGLCVSQGILPQHTLLAHVVCIGRRSSASQLLCQDIVGTLHAALQCTNRPCMDVSCMYFPCVWLLCNHTLTAVCRFDPATSDFNELKRLLTFSTKFVNSLHLQQLPSHLDLQIILEAMRR